MKKYFYFRFFSFQSCLQILQNTKLFIVVKTATRPHDKYSLTSRIGSYSQLYRCCPSEMKLDFRYLRKLKMGMEKADKKRSQFKVQTYRQMVEQARREGKCTLIYRSYGK